jgi:hypothetical protein
MRVALCISGELRRVKTFFPAIERHILEPYNPDVFISTWDMPSGIPTSVALTERDPAKLATFDETVDMYKPLGTYRQKYDEEIKKYLKSVGNTPTDNLLCMSFHIMKSLTLAMERTQLTGQLYDVIVRYRFDYAVKIKFEDFDMSNINIPAEHGYGGYQDQFAFGGTNAMMTYGLWFPNLPIIERDYAQANNLPTNLLDRPPMPYNPESALKRYLTLTNTKVSLIQNLEIRYPWSKPEEIEELYD